MNETALIGIGTIVMSNAAEIPVHFSAHTYPFDVILLGPKVRPVEAFTNIFDPYSQEVWILIITSLLIGSLTMTVFLHQQSILLPSKQRKNTKKKERSILLCYGSMCSQSKKTCMKKAAMSVV